MTTIAYRAGVLAADSLIAYGSYTNGERSKIAQCGRRVVALAGSTWLRIPLERWVNKGCPESEVPNELLENESDFDCLILDAEGKVFCFAKGYLLPVPGEYCAIGSGKSFALGAMAAGATAEEAVRASARHDKNTGGEVTSIRFPLN